jgi:hypothetical protein
MLTILVRLWQLCFESAFVVEASSSPVDGVVQRHQATGRARTQTRTVRRTHCQGVTRHELIAAVMGQWEAQATNMVIASVAEVANPMDPLR